jgi:uncharacterized protein YaaN involved in tellurite resistance
MTMSEVKLAETPTLTFEPFKEEPQTPAAVLQNTEVSQPADYDDSMLTDEEKQMVKNFAAQIDIANSAQVLQYGAGAQQKVASFSEKALDNVRTKDLGEVGNMISGVVTELKSFDVEEDEKGFLGLFKKNVNKLTAMKAKYAKAETNVNQIVDALEQHQVTLMKDVATLDQLYDLNKTYYKELTMYILAGKQKLHEVETVDIPALTAKAEASGLPEDAQAVTDMSSLANRFEKKLHDLELTRMIAIQMAPQIRLVQNNDTMMSDKIQSTIVNTIPLWKSQMVIALGIAHSEQAAKVQHEVSDLTNAMLKKNAEKLKTASIDVAKESERGIVDIETLKTTNEALISTLDEVLKIQVEGREKRQAAEVELRKIEGDLKEKLLSMRTSVQG